MKITPSQIARLEFLLRVTQKECQHLLDTDGRLFALPFTQDVAQTIEADPILAERPVDGNAPQEKPFGCCPNRSA